MSDSEIIIKITLKQSVGVYFWQHGTVFCVPN